MNCCMCGVNFIMLPLLKHELWHSKVEKVWCFMCADMVDFRRPGHICPITADPLLLLYIDWSGDFVIILLGRKHC